MSALRAWSTRTHLLLLVLVALLPAAGILVHRSLEAERQVLAQARRQAQDRVEDLAAHQAIQTDNFRKYLSLMASLPNIRKAEPEASGRLLKALADPHQEVFTLLVVDPQGRVIASSRGVESFQVGDRRYFTQVQRQGRFSSGEFVLSRIHGQGTFHYALPVLNEKGHLACVLAVGLDPQHLLGSHGELQAPGQLLLIDHLGQVIRGRGPGAPPPGTLLGGPLSGQVLGTSEQGHFTIWTPGGEQEVFYRQIRIEGEASPHLTVVAELPTATLLAPLRAARIRDLSLLGLVLALSVFLALGIGEWAVLAPLRNMLARALAPGPQTQPTLARGSSEIRDLDAAFSEMTRGMGEREQRLQHSEARLRTILETIHEAIFLHDPATGRILEVSPRACEMFGLSPAELLASTIEDLSSGVPPFTQAEALAWMQKAEAEGPQTFPWESRHRDGRVFPSEVNLTVTRLQGEPRILVSVRDVSERSRAHQVLLETQAALKERKDLLELFFAQSMDGFYIMTLDEPVPWGPPSEQPAQLERILDGMRMRRLNRAMAQQYGEPVQALLGRSLREFYAHDPEALRTGILTLLNQGRDHQITRERRADGSEIWIEGDYLCLFTEDGKVRGHFGIQRDISDRVRTEHALTASEQRLKGIFDHTTTMLGVLSPTGILLDANRTALAFAGVPPEEVLGKPFRETPWWPESEAVRAQVRQAVEEAAAGRTVRFETQHPDSQGGLHLVDFSLRPILDESGAVLFLLPEGRDVSELRRSEAAAQEREQLFRLLFDRSGDPNLLIDGNLFMDCNPAAVATLGARSRDQVLNTHPADLSPEFQPDGRTSREKADEMIAQAFERGSHRFEWVHQRQDGSSFPVDVRLTAIPWGGRWILHTAWRDLTDRERAEAERRSLEAQMLQAQKLESLGVLAGGIAHDFNNLLTAILGNLNLAQDRLGGESPAQPLLENAERTALKAAELAQQMLAYSGRGQFVVRQMDLNALVEEMGKLLRVSIPKKVALIIRPGEALPPILADVAQLQQVVLNLVTNAAEAIGDQEGAITLKTGCADLGPAELRENLWNAELRPGRFVTLEVRDTGCGIPPRVLSRIFDPFFTTKKSGRGLGLSAMLGILRAHGAGLRVQSREGQGTTFTVFLPAQEGKAEVAVPSPEPTTAPTGGHVLVVDDEPMLRDTLGQALELWGYRVTCAQDGQEALDLVKADPTGFDLVLMDLTMPRLDGREAFLEMRKLAPGLKVVLSSGFSEQESLHPLFDLGLHGFIQKPYALKELRKRVSESLGSGTPEGPPPARP